MADRYGPAPTELLDLWYDSAPSEAGGEIAEAAWENGDGGIGQGESAELQAWGLCQHESRDPSYFYSLSPPRSPGVAHHRIPTPPLSLRLRRREPQRRRSPRRRRTRPRRLRSPQQRVSRHRVPPVTRARGSRDINGTFAYVVPAGIDEVRVSYRRETSDQGWRPTSSVTTDDGRFTMLVLEKGDVNVGVSITVLGQNTSFVTLGIY